MAGLMVFFYRDDNLITSIGASHRSHLHALRHEVSPKPPLDHSALGIPLARHPPFSAEEPFLFSSIGAVAGRFARRCGDCDSAAQCG
jgi:hypothetical protein